MSTRLHLNFNFKRYRFSLSLFPSLHTHTHTHIYIYIYKYIYIYDGYSIKRGFFLIIFSIIINTALFRLVLYNDYWHEFWVRSWWPHVLWQAVTLWLVNRGGQQCVRVGRSSKCVTGRRPRDMRIARSDLDSPVRIERRTRDTQPIRGVSVVSDDTACKGGASVGTPWLSICLSIYL